MLIKLYFLTNVQCFLFILILYIIKLNKNILYEASRYFNLFLIRIKVLVAVQKSHLVEK